MKKIINEWKKSFEDAVASIEDSITPQAHDDSQTTKFRQLAQWMLKSEHSPYDYMSLGHQSFKSTPYATDFSLNMLHHALVDDGDIAFVTFKVEGETQKVFMIFADRHDNNFDKLCREENKTAIDSFIHMRESYMNVMNNMKQKFPDKELTTVSSLKDSDFTFNAHSDPLLFIKEVEDFQLIKAEKNKILNEKMVKIRAGKP